MTVSTTPVSMNVTRAMWEELDRTASAFTLATATIRRGLADADPATPLDWSDGYTVADLLADADHYHGHTVGSIDRLAYLAVIDEGGIDDAPVEA